MIWWSWRSAGAGARRWQREEREMPMASASLPPARTVLVLPLSLGSGSASRFRFRRTVAPSRCPTGAPERGEHRADAKMAVPPSHICGVRMSRGRPEGGREVRRLPEKSEEGILDLLLARPSTRSRCRLVELIAPRRARIMAGA